MTFQDFVTKNKPLLQAHLTDYLQGKKTEKSTLPFYTESIERLEKMSTAGKMWRGLFVLLIYEMVTGKPYPQELLNAAVALELVQSALLIHDDIIDNDFTRRGQKTIFAQYIKNNDETYGKNMGIVVGDIAIFLAYNALSQTTDNGQHLQNVIQLFSRELHSVGIGEMIDIDMAFSTEKPTLEEIIDMYRFKTARYSFSLPFLIGALLSGSNMETQTALDTFGENTGILFQIHDDALGLTGDEKTTGKPVGSDIKENKKTLHRQLLFDSATVEDRQALEECFGNKNLTMEQRTFALELLEKYKIPQQVGTSAQPFQEAALTALQKLPFSEEHKKMLEDILEKVLQRTN